ncbi:hypothetical protein [Pseudactinotalea suaedae]|uniref:hypothetical protein n=1 Tax=Pseudactinotalea suaedae TaxID=1524924 RepID=UPI0012E1DBD9|nr:hypothetical protein [Pseudactinotalea suaedae]
MTTRPSLVIRIWRAIRSVVGSLFGPDPVSDARITRQAQVHPRQEQQGRTFQGGLGG